MEGIASAPNNGRIGEVLIVDDDLAIGEQLRREFQRNFFSASLLTSGKETKDYLSRKGTQIDLVVLDLKLPDICGVDLLDFIKERYPHTEVIVITGFGSIDLAIQTLHRGAIDYLEKPVDSQALLDAVGRAMERKREKEQFIDNTRTVLVMDDDEMTCEYLKQVMEMEGYTVFVAWDGESALQLIETNRIDLMLADLRMPGMDGIESIRRAKIMQPDIEAIVITGYSDEQAAIDALRAGAIGYNTKPINPLELIHTVKSAVSVIDTRRLRKYRDRERQLSAQIIQQVNAELEKKVQVERQDREQQSKHFQATKLATLGEMAAGLAHEINQPLGVIMLAIKTLLRLNSLERLSKEELGSGLQDIQDAANRIHQVILHVRNFAKQDQFQFESVDLPSTIDAAIARLQERTSRLGIAVTKHVDGELPRILGEAHQLEQVWINLLHNACDSLEGKYTPHGADGEMASSGEKAITLSCCCQPDTGRVQVVIRDNGPGIAPQILGRVFEPFFTTKEVGMGMGMGLATCYGIVEGHGGRIEAAGAPGQGCEIRVLLPV